MKEKISSELQITMDKVNYYGSKHSANKNLYIAESIDNHLETSEEYINRFRKQKIYLNVPKYKAADKKVISVEEAKQKFYTLKVYLQWMKIFFSIINCCRCRIRNVH